MIVGESRNIIKSLLRVAEGIGPMTPGNLDVSGVKRKRC